MSQRINEAIETIKQVLRTRDRSIEALSRDDSRVKRVKLEADAKKLQARVDDLRYQCRNLVVGKDEAIARVEVLEAELARVMTLDNKQINMDKKTIAGLEAGLEKKQEAITTLTKHVHGMEHNISRKSQKLEAENALLINKNAENTKKLKYEIGTMAALKGLKETEVSKLMVLLETAKIKERDLNNELSHTQGRNMALVQKLEDATKERDALRGDISFLDGDRPEGKELSDLRKFKLMIDDIGMLFPKSHYATSLLKKIDTLKKELERVTGMDSKLRGRVAGQADELERLEAEVGRIANERDELKKELGGSKITEGSITIMNSELRRRGASLEAANIALGKKLDASEDNRKNEAKGWVSREERISGEWAETVKTVRNRLEAEKETLSKELERVIGLDNKVMLERKEEIAELTDQNEKAADIFKYLKALMKGIE